MYGFSRFVFHSKEEVINNLLPFAKWSYLSSFCIKHRLSFIYVIYFYDDIYAGAYVGRGNLRRISHYSTCFKKPEKYKQRLVDTMYNFCIENPEAIEKIRISILEFVYDLIKLEKREQFWITKFRKDGFILWNKASSPRPILALSNKDVIRLLNCYTKSKTLFYNGTPCWIAKRLDSSKKYGQFAFRHYDYRAHRVMYTHYMRQETGNSKWEMTHEGSHLCHNKACMNPDHITDESQSDNMRRTTNNGLSKRQILTLAQATEIRKKYHDTTITTIDLAKEYNTTHENIHRIIHNGSYYDPNYTQTRKQISNTRKRYICYTSGSYRLQFQMSNPIILINGKKLKRFKTLEEAISVRNRLLQQHHIPIPD